MSWLRRTIRRDPDPAALAEQVPPGPLRTYLRTPPPPADTPADSLPMLTLDLETTGLDPGSDAILSYGWVPVDAGSITLAGARHILVRADRDVGASATIHGITDDELATGISPASALDDLFTALTGRVLLAHHARLEVGFVAAATERAYGIRPPFVVVDTMETERRIQTTPWVPEPRPGSLRLWAARERYRLPVYRAHNALADAQSCAELHLAQVAELAACSDRPPTLGSLRTPISSS